MTFEPRDVVERECVVCHKIRRVRANAVKVPICEKCFDERVKPLIGILTPKQIVHLVEHGGIK